MPPADHDYAQSAEIVDACMEWIGMRWTTSMIKRELRAIAALYLSDRTCKTVIRAAEARIRKLYGIEPQYYKGKQIAFYEYIIRKQGEKTKDKLAAAERLDKLFGLDQISGVDPEATARRIRDELQAMDESMNIGEQNGGDQENEQRSTNGGEGENEKRVDESVETDGANKTEKQEIIDNEDNICDSELSTEALDFLNNIPEKDMEKFRKARKERREL